MRIKKDAILDGMKNVEKYLLHNLMWPTMDSMKRSNPEHIRQFKEANVCLIAKQALDLDLDLEEFKDNHLNEDQYKQFIKVVVENFRKLPISNVEVYHTVDNTDSCHDRLKELMDQEWDRMIEPFYGLLKAMKECNRQFEEMKKMEDNFGARLDEKDLKKIEEPLCRLNKRYEYFSQYSPSANPKQPAGIISASSNNQGQPVKVATTVSAHDEIKLPQSTSEINAAGNNQAQGQKVATSNPADQRVNGSVLFRSSASNQDQRYRFQRVKEDSNPNSKCAIS